MMATRPLPWVMINFCSDNLKTVLLICFFPLNHVYVKRVGVRVHRCMHEYVHVA